MGIDILLGLVGTLGGMVLPPIVDFIRKKFIPEENDTPERTMGTLATTKPEVLPGYVESLSKYLQAETAYFNRDIAGKPTQWIVDLRAAIRPLAVAGSFIALGLEAASVLKIEPVTRAGLLTVIGNWIGSRIIQ
jgi:hypothetical protein